MVSEITTGAELRGLTRRIVLNDGNPRDLNFDFLAQCVIEETMRSFGLRPEVEQARMLKEQVDKAAATEAGVEYVAPIVNDGPGYFRSIGIFAYALTASWREDNGEADMTFREFAKLLPIRPLARMHSWTNAVNAVMASETDESPNGESPVPPPAASSETPADDSGSSSQPTGISCGTAPEASSESAPAESSGA